MKKLKISRLTPDSRYLQTVALKTEAVQARQLFRLGKGAHTHRTGYFIMKIIEQSLNIHNEGREAKVCNSK